MTGDEFNALTVEQIQTLIAQKTALRAVAGQDYQISDLAAREYNMLTREIVQLQERLLEIQ